MYSLCVRSRCNLTNGNKYKISINKQATATGDGRIILKTIYDLTWRNDE